MAAPFIIIQLSDMPIYLPRLPSFSTGTPGDGRTWLALYQDLIYVMGCHSTVTELVYIPIHIYFAKSSLSMPSGLGPHTSLRDRV